MPANIPTQRSCGEAIDCEIAADVIAEFIANYAKQLAEAKCESERNDEKVQLLESQLVELKKEKFALNVDRSERIRKALYIYAPLLKTIAQHPAA